MKLRVIISVVLMSMVLSIFSLGSGISVGAEGLKGSEQKMIEKVRKQIEKNTKGLNKVLSNLQKEENVELGDVEAVIESYFAENPFPEDVLNNVSFTIDDVFPIDEKNKVQQKNQSINISEHIDYAKKNKNDGYSVYEFINKNGKVSVVVSQTGEVTILDETTTPEVIVKDNNDGIGIYAVPYETSKTQRSTGVAYNSFGSKLFTLWAEGSFRYNGTSVLLGNSDGDVQRHFWGSTMVLTTKAEGKARDVWVGSEKYVEVYTRVYFEAQFGIRWAGLTLNSGTVEAYVGGSKYGHTYGGVKTL